jgi:predicted RNase H-like nuclease (RuvC/YqgF family)
LGLRRNGGGDNAVCLSKPLAMQKPLLFAAIILSLGAAAVGYLNHDKLANLKDQAAKATSESQDAQKKLQATAKDLKAAKDKADQISKDAEKNSGDLADLRSQLSSATSGMSDLQKENADIKAKLAQKDSDMAAKDSRIAELESKGSGSSSGGGSDEAKKQLEEQKLLTAKLETKLKDQESQLSVLKEREAQRRTKIMRNGLEGRILAVNPSWNFVVLSLGDRNGVVNNSEMLIKRGSQLIGKVRITSVEPSTSVADIVANSVRNGLSVQPGDSVIYLGPGEDSSETAKLP